MQIRSPHRRAGIVVLLFALLSISASAATISVADSVLIGDLLTATIEAGPWVDAVEVELRKGAWKIAGTWAFRRRGSNDWVALLGVPSWSDSGAHTVTAYLYSFQDRGIANGEDRDIGIVRVVQRRTSVVVTYREFFREEISLSSAMSNLRQDQSPERSQESRQLEQVLRTTDITAVHSLEPLQLPIDTERRTSHFGDRRTFRYSDGGTTGAIHHGIDFGAPTGTPVYAAGAGRVVVARTRILTGFTVVIEHLPGVYTLYYHLDRIDVPEGNIVGSGRQIGTVGSTGLVTGPHLHWEMRAAAVPIDPEPFLSRPILDILGVSGNIDGQ